MTKILRLQSENVKRLVAVDIRPDGSVVLLGGKNAAGKSSTLDSIMYALGGAKTIPAEPVRKGQRRAKTVVELDNGLVVTRTFDAGGAGGSKLEVREKGAALKSPQAILDALVGAISFDPLEYSRKKPEEQAMILRGIAGVDTTKLDQERDGLFAERTEQNRTVKQLKAQVDAAPSHADAPKEPVSVAALTEQLEEAGETREANQARRRQLEATIGEAESTKESIGEVDGEIEDLEADLAKLRGSRSRWTLRDGRP